MSENEPVQGRVVSPANRPKLYVVETPTGPVEGNRSQLQVIPNAERAKNSPQSGTTAGSETETQPEPPRRIMTRSRTGIKISKPKTFIASVKLA